MMVMMGSVYRVYLIIFDVRTVIYGSLSESLLHNSDLSLQPHFYLVLHL